MKARNLIESFNYAIQGIIYAIQTQRNMKIHLFCAVGVLILSLFFNFSKVEIMTLSFSIALVIALEMINTAIESAIDLFTEKYHPLAKIAKNVAAGAVLIAAINAVFTGYLLFFDKLKPVSDIIAKKVKQSPTHITFITFAIVMIAVVGAKAYFKKGTPLKGGMPSGHSAIAFSFATLISLITSDTLVATLSFIMAALVAQTRIEADVHSVYETFAGGLIGIFITILIYKIFQ